MQLLQRGIVALLVRQLIDRFSIPRLFPPPKCGWFINTFGFSEEWAE
jgi:hypothetical protein